MELEACAQRSDVVQNPGSGMPRAGFTAEERRITLWAVGLVFLLSALDQTVVSTAMPRIVADLQGLALYAWVTTAYMLTSTVLVPIWGKLGDLRGRKGVLVCGILLFALGSCLSGFAGEFGPLPLLGGGGVQLVVSRAVQGIGGGALFITAFAIVADLYPPRERSRLAGMFGAVFGVSSTLGPLIGGYFADHGTVHVASHVIAGWRWIFFLNLPLAAVSLFLIGVKMPRLPPAAAGRVDLVGAALMIAALTPLLLALSFGGHERPWASPLVVSLFAASGVACALYILVERYTPDPILPLGLFRNPVFCMANLAAFLVSMSFVSTVTFLPLFMQLGQGVAATVSGLTSLPLMVGLILSSMAAGQIAARTGRLKPLIGGGVALIGLSVFLLSRITPQTAPLHLAWRMLLLGVGLGPVQGLISLAVQNAMPARQVGVATSSSQFFWQIGSIVGVALFGALLSRNLDARLAQLGPGLDLAALQGLAASASAQGRPPTLPHDLAGAVASAVTSVFGLGLWLTAAGLLVVFLMPRVQLRDGGHETHRGEPGAAVAEVSGL